MVQILKSRWGALLLALVLALGAYLFPSPDRAAQEANGGDGPRASDAWEVAAEPIVALGLQDDNPDAVLHVVRSAVRLGDGRIVVAHGGLASRLGLFGPDGAYLQALGGQGEGPGEYRWITTVAAGPDESVWVFDAGLQRLTVFGADGEPTRTASYRSTTGRGLLTVDPLADGSAWFGRELFWVRSGQPGVIYRDTISVGILDSELASFTPVAELPDLMFTTTLPPSGRRSYRAPAFSPWVIHAVWGRCAFVSTGDNPTITVLGPEGEVVRTLTGPGDSREVTEADLLVHEEALVEWSTGDERARDREMFRAEAKVTHLPYYYGMVADEWGQLWLQEYTPPWGVGRRWYIISQSGDRLATVSMPRALMVFSISRHGVLGSSRGALGEESVELLPFTRMPSEFSEPIPECQEGPR